MSLKSDHLELGLSIFGGDAPPLLLTIESAGRLRALAVDVRIWSGGGKFEVLLWG